MAISTLDIAAETLKSVGYYKTSWEELEIAYDHQAAQTLFDIIPKDPPRVIDVDEILHESRIATPESDAAVQRLGAPVIARLFPGNQFAQERTSVFGINYYRTGDLFSFHTDFEEPERVTAVVLSLSGVRNLVVNGNGHKMEPGSIMLLDGMWNHLHSAHCIEGPSVSAVIDIPELLYPVEDFEA